MILIAILPAEAVGIFFSLTCIYSVSKCEHNTSVKMFSLIFRYFMSYKDGIKH